MGSAVRIRLSRYALCAWFDICSEFSYRIGLLQYEVTGEIGKWRPQGAFGTLRGEQTTLGGAARFQADASVASMDAVSRARAVVRAQRFELPIGAGDHVNA